MRWDPAWIRAIAFKGGFMLPKGLSTREEAFALGTVPTQRFEETAKSSWQNATGNIHGACKTRGMARQSKRHHGNQKVLAGSSF